MSRQGGQDAYGKPWAKLSSIKVGAWVRLDAGFTCARAGPVLVREDEGGRYFRCSEGHHYLAGQANASGHCVGVYPITGKDE